MDKRIKRRLAALLGTLPVSSTRLGPPKRAAWDVASDVSAGRTILPVETPRETLVEPELLCGLEYEPLRATLIQEIKPLQVARLAGGRYFQPSFAVIDASDTLLYDYTHGWEAAARLNNYVFEEIRLPQARRLAGKTLLLDVRSHSQNYFHWLVEGVSKIPVLAKAGIALDEISHVLVSRPNLPFHAETFRRMGLDPGKIVDASQTPHWQCEELIAVSDTREFLYRTGIDDLRGLFGAPRTGGERRLYISRRDAPSRRVANEDALTPVLERFGFETVTLTGLSVADQAALFGSAACIVAPHGAGLANLLFCQPGALLVELHQPDYLKALYWRIASAMGVRYAALAGQTGVAAPPWDLRIDPATLGEALRKLLPDPGFPSRPAGGEKGRNSSVDEKKR